MKSCERVEKLCVYQPSVRMIVIDAWANEDDPETTGYHLLPVVAIEATVVADYWPEGDRWVRQPSECRKDFVEHQPIVCDADGSLTTLRDLLDSKNVWCRAVACDWPGEEDEERLAPIIRETLDMATTRTRNTESRQNGLAAAVQ